MLEQVRINSQEEAEKKYYKSEKKLQKYMLVNKIIGHYTYYTNVFKRLIIQVLMPNKLRAFIYKRFARKKIK